MPKAKRAQEEREKRADPDEPPDAEELKLVALEARRQRLQSTPYQAVPAQVGPPQVVRFSSILCCRGNHSHVLYAGASMQCARVWMR